MKASDLIAIFPTCTKIGPHRPFQFAGHAPRTDYVPSNEELGRTLALLRAEFAGMTKRERNAAEWSAAYGRHRDSGAEPALAAERATAEMRTAPRFRAPDPNARTVRPINPGLYDLEEGLTDDGHAIRRLGDCDGPDVAAHRPGSGEGLGLSLENHDGISSARSKVVHQAEMDFAADCTAETGAAISPEQYEKNQKRRGKLRQMSAQIVAMLAEAGVNAMRTDAAKVYAFYVHSRTFELLPAYRRICFIPEVAAALRAPKLAALEYWLERHPYARFWTFTAGERVTLRTLEERIGWLHRKLSKLNHELARFGVEIVFRSTEFGTLERKTDSLSEREAGGGLLFENGEPLFHPHAHCVVLAKFGYNATKWREACEFVRDFWRRGGQKLHCDFGEIIGSAREACKYVTKPGDLLQLTPAQLRQLYEITYRAKLCHPLGSLAREIRIREGHTVEIENKGAKHQARTLRALASKHDVELPALVAQNPRLHPDVDRPLDFGTKVVIHPGGLCLRRIRRGTRMVWVERLDHNKANRETEAEKAERINLEDAMDFREEARRAADHGSASSLPAAALADPSFIGPCPHVIAEEWWPENGIIAPAPHLGAATRVMARIMPAAGPSRVKEPRVIVLSVDGRLDRAAVESHPLVIGLWQDTVQAWEDGLDTARREDAAAAMLDRYSVHTGTPIVQGRSETEPPDPNAAFLRAEREVWKASAALGDGINF